MVSHYISLLPHFIECTQGDNSSQSHSYRRKFLTFRIERGEAPPPYVPGSKPPSLHSNDGLSRAESGRSVNRRPSSERDVELGDMTRPVYAPPAYHDPPGSAMREGASEGGGEGITRPNAVITR